MPAEVEGLPPGEIGARLGVRRGAAAVLVHRAREGLRPAHLRAGPGSPHRPSCAGRWAAPAGHARGRAGRRAGQRVERHLPHCADWPCCAGSTWAWPGRRAALLAALLGPPAGGAGQRGAGAEAGSTGAATDPRAAPEVFTVNGRPCRVKVW
ncbi:hypothetical protein GCM10010195_41170 [Kitasatospora griseola]|nr:hypothetical protein GCM10010195_41170 [Kitasatospora griseola]